MSRNVEQTRLRLLAAARAEFAAYGISGSRVDRIAQRAGVNKERIYGHFGSKEKLFEAVIDEALQEMAAAVTPPGDGDVASYVGRVFDYHASNQDVLRLLMWEGLHYGAEPLPNERERRERYDERLAILAKATRSNVSTELSIFLLVLLGLASLPFASPQFTRLVTSDTATEAELRRFITEFVAIAAPDAIARLPR